MCMFQQIASCSFGHISICQNCQTYKVEFNNVQLHLDIHGFMEFKRSFQESYDFYVKRCLDATDRLITFDTSCKGIKFVFSTQEVGELLSMFQEAELAFYLTVGVDLEDESCS